MASDSTPVFFSLLKATPPVFTTERDVPEDCGGMRPLPSAAGGGRGPGIVVPESARTPNSLTCGEERWAEGGQSDPGAPLEDKPGQFAGVRQCPP